MQRRAIWFLLLLAGGAAAQDAAYRTEPVVTQAEGNLLDQVIALESSNRPEAIRRLRQAIRPDSSAALDFALGALLARENRLPEAEGAYDAATRKLPAFARAWGELGRIRLLLDRPGAAAPALAKAIEHGRSSAELWKLLAHCHSLLERYPASVAAYHRALALEPEDPEVRAGLVQSLLAAERPAEAIPLLRELCARRPREEQNWLLLANAHLAQEHDESALEVLECARQVGVLGPAARLTLGDLCYQKGLYRMAAERYGEAGDAGVGPDRILNCAEALFYLGRTEDAERLLGRAREGELTRPAPAFLLEGRIAARRGEVEAAKQAFGSALEADPLEGEAMLALGRIHFEEGDLDRARIVLERASRVKSTARSALVLLAQVEVEGKRYDRAVEHLERALALERDAGVERYLEQVRRIARLGKSE